MIIDALAQGRALDEVASATECWLRQRGEKEAETMQAIRKSIALAAQGPGTPARVEQLGGRWVGEEALAIGLYCALVSRTFRTACVWL